MKQIYLIRHGELANPKGIVYSRDSLMRSVDIIHLSDIGRTQFLSLAEEMKKQGKIPDLLWSSPETRAQESAEILRAELCLDRVLIKPDLDDVYAPGMYLEGMLMAEFEATAVNSYDLKRWKKYKHETAQELTKRMLAIVDKMVTKLVMGQIGALISHGDPIAFLLNYLQDGIIPNPAEIRNMMYSPKGSATLLTYSDTNDFVKLEPFGDPSLRRGSNY